MKELERRIEELESLNGEVPNVEEIVLRKLRNVNLELARQAINAPDIDTVISMMGIVEPPFASRLRINEKGGDKHER